MFSIVGWPIHNNQGIVTNNMHDESLTVHFNKLKLYAYPPSNDQVLGDSNIEDINQSVVPMLNA